MISNNIEIYILLTSHWNIVSSAYGSVSASHLSYILINFVQRKNQHAFVQMQHH